MPPRLSLRLPFWRRRPAPVPRADWEAVAARVALLQGLGPQEEAALRGLAARFLAEKAITGAQGLEPDGTLRLAIAAQACLPVLGLGLEAYRGWHEVVVYPGAFLSVQRWTDEAGVEHEARRPLTGESWPQGPVVLSEEDLWAGAEALDGYNVVVHEMAHKLDLQNGEANGFPPLHPDMDRRAWTAAFQAAYGDLERRVEAGQPTALDPYAAETPGEFFACASEAFFEIPAALAEAYPAVYAQLRAYYRQDPLQRLAHRRVGRSGTRPGDGPGSAREREAC